MNPQEYIRKEAYKLYINGEFVVPEGAQTFDIVTPYLLSPSLPRALLSFIP